MWGELDGLLPWYAMAPYIAQSAAAAARQGAGYAATHQGAVVLPRTSHAQMSNGKNRTDPGGTGDIRVGLLPYNESVQQQAEPVSAFLKVHNYEQRPGRPQSVCAGRTLGWHADHSQQHAVMGCCTSKQLSIASDSVKPVSGAVPCVTDPLLVAWQLVAWEQSPLIINHWIVRQ